MTDLPSLRRDTKITEEGYPTLHYHQWWDALAKALGSDLTDMQSAINSIQLTQTALENGFKEIARITSYPSPTDVLSAADVGSDVTITVAAHTRVYTVRGPNQIEDVPITTGDITGLSFSTLYYVYYDDETLSESSPTFVATTDAAEAQVGGGSGRHYLGSITTPADGAGGTTGTGPKPPGGDEIP